MHANDIRLIKALKAMRDGANPAKNMDIRIIVHDAMSAEKVTDGGPGSGNHNHAGNPGHVGGSAPSGHGGGGSESSGSGKSSSGGGLGKEHVTSMEKFHKEALKHDKDFLGDQDAIDSEVKKQYKRDMGLLFDSEGNPYDFAKKVDTMEEYVKLPFQERVQSFVEYDKYKDYAMQNSPWEFAAPGSICDTLRRYNLGATQQGYGKGKGQRLRFDQETGLSKYIDSHPDIQYNGGTLYRGIETNKGGYSEIKKALKSGQPITMRGPSSWSIDERVAQEFTKYSLRASGKGQKVVFVEEGDKKRKAIPFPYSMAGINGNQQEVLYSGSARFKVKDIQEKDGVAYVRVESEE